MSLGINLNGYWREWHVGEPVPKEFGRVVQFQADGDELDLIVDAMQASRGEHPTTIWSKGESFGVKPPPPPKRYRIWYTPYGDSKAVPTGHVISGELAQVRADRWTHTHVANGGTWSIKEEA